MSNVYTDSLIFLLVHVLRHGDTPSSEEAGRHLDAVRAEENRFVGDFPIDEISGEAEPENKEPPPPEPAEPQGSGEKNIAGQAAEPDPEEKP